MMHRRSVFSVIILATISSALSPLNPTQQSARRISIALRAARGDDLNTRNVDIRSSSTTSSRRSFVNRMLFSVALAGTGFVLPTIAEDNVAHAAQTLPATGKKAPDFDLPNSRKEGTTSLSSLTSKGKWTVLYFYPGAFTSGCTLEARNFQRDFDQYKQLNTQIVGVSVDPVEKNAQFCSAENLDFYMLSDQGGEVSKLYGSALSVPGFGSFSNRQTYLIDPQGNLRWVFTDVESRIPRHSAEVLEKLTELQQEKL